MNPQLSFFVVAPKFRWWHFKCLILEFFNAVGGIFEYEFRRQAENRRVAKNWRYTLIKEGIE
jgi:uncharacterized protein (DUF779 family)